MLSDPKWAIKLLLLEKAATLMLLLSFLLSPLSTLAQVEGETGDTGDTSGNQSGEVIEVIIDNPGSTEPTPEPVEPAPEPIEPTPEPETPEPAPDPIDETPEDPVVENPEVSPELEPEALAAPVSTYTEEGALFINNETTRSAAPNVDTQTGALRYDYELTIPPGRDGVQPDLRLEYSSNSVGNASAFGYGWSVSIPAITRTHKQGVNTLYTSNYFTSSLDGELMQVGSTTTYMPRVENGSFRQYKFENSAWTVTEKDGTVMSFGSTTAARRDDPSNSSRIYSWNLEEVRDTNSNYIEYGYFKDSGQVYPNTISYTGSGSTDGIFLIEFERATRSDNLVSYDTGFAASTTYRINRIEANVNGQWVFAYDLGYTTGQNGNRSLLSTLTKSGKDESGNIVTLPSVNFGYETYGSTDKQWDYDSRNVPVNIVYTDDIPDDAARFVDINGDTLPDILRSPDTQLCPCNTTPVTTQEVYLNTGTTWATSTDWTIPHPLDRFGFAHNNLPYSIDKYAKGVDLGARFADVNADGYTDILWAYKNDFSQSLSGYNHHYEFREVYINNKTNGWATSTQWIFPSDLLFGQDQLDAGARVADLNGDSLPDLLSYDCSASSKAYLNTGAGWAAATSSAWLIPEPLSCAGDKLDKGVRIADVNGDGLADIVRAYESDSPSYYASKEVYKVYINNGSGWTHAPAWTSFRAFAERDEDTNRNLSLSTRLTDVNGDGLPDLIQSSTQNGYTVTGSDGNAVYLNTGEGWSLDSDWTVPPYFKFVKSDGANKYYLESGFAEMDVNGDNLIDFVKSGITSTDPYPHDEGVYLHEGKVPDLLSSIEYAEGGEITAAYEQSAQYAESSTRLNPRLSSNLNTVKQVTYDSSEGTPYTHTYSYGGGENYYASSTDKQFAGFATTTQQDARGNITKTYIHQANGTQDSFGEGADAFAKIGKPYRVDRYDDSGNLYTRSLYKWDSASTSSSTAYVFNTQEIDQQYDGDSDHRDTAVEREYDALGNVLSTTEWGEAIASTTDGTFSDIGSDKKKTTYQYASSTTSYLTGLPASIAVADQASQKVKETKYYYDNQSAGVATIGNPTKRDEWKEGSDFATTKWNYNSYGLVTQEIGPRNATTTYAYDTNNLYPTPVTNALGHTSSSTYAYSLGKPKAITDSNGYVTSWTYDGLGRMLSESRPDPGTGSSVLTLTNSYTDTRNKFSVVTDTHLTSSTTVQRAVYHDGFGRKIQERSEAEVGFAVRDFVYGSDGYLTQESLPYFSDGVKKRSKTSTTTLYAIYQYDPLGRVTSNQNAVGTTEHAYDQWKETVTDPLDNVKDYTHDAYKNLSAVIEQNGSNTYTTAYGWDLNKNLVKITDALGNTRAFTYDGLGNRLTAEDLHGSGDQTFGTWNYDYDSARNLIEVVDPKNQTIGYTHDLLNRQLSENYTGGSGTEITYTYDSCTNGVGKLCSVGSTGASTTYAYSPNGLVNQETRLIGGSSFITAYTYDRSNNKKEITYPDNSIVRYLYNTGGRIDSIEQKESGAQFEPMVVEIDYAPTGQVSYQKNANCTVIRNIYDAEALYRLKRKVVDRIGCEDLQQLMSMQNSSLQSEPEVDPTAYFNEEGQLLDMSQAEMPALSEGKSLDQATTSVMTMMEFPSNDILDTATASEQMVSPKDDSLKLLPIDSPELKLKAVPERHLGKKTENGIVKYAYRTDTLVDSLPISKKSLKAAKDKGVTITGEAKEKRTKFSRTYATNTKGVYVAEIIAGDPQYYQDETGQWWLADYGITTIEAYEQQTSVPEIRDAEKEKKTIRAVVSSIFDLFKTNRAYAADIFYPDPNTEVTSFDGDAYRGDSTNWSYVRNASTASTANDAGTGLGVTAEKGTPSGSTKVGVRRTFLLFDTTAIPDAASINSATIELTVTGTAIAYDAVKKIHAVSSNPASNTAITTDDYDQLGSTSFGESDDSYDSIPLNSLGIASVNKTGVSKFGLRAHNDLYDLGAGSSNEFHVGLRASETAGTSQDPRLVIVYNATPTVAVNLQAESQVNPTQISDHTPEFSAVYVNPDITDSTGSYRIQVSPSATDWSNPHWDSGKQNLSASTTSGYRTPDISYTGDKLLSEMTYYWRIKFWDSFNAEGTWSTTTASFSLGPSEDRLFDSVYEYDAVGNITAIVDITNIANPSADVYAYDDLYRLTSVGTSTAALDFEENYFVMPEIVVQPDADEGKDTNYGTVYVTGGGPNEAIARIGGWGDSYFSYFKFPISDLPEGEDIVGAKLYLFNEYTAGLPNDAKFYRITSSWTESGVTNSNNPSSVDYGMPWQSVPTNAWFVVDVTQLVKDWKSGEHTNYGIKVAGRYNAGDYVKGFTTSDSLNTTNHPKLIVTGNNDVYSFPGVTVGSTTNVINSYTYDPLGNITSSLIGGSYTYGGTDLVNPHAVTSIASTTYSYDDNGNLTSEGSGTLLWNYKNHLTGSSIGTTTATYGYDHTGSRVFKTSGGLTIYYPNNLYEVVGTSTTKHLYLSDTLVATVAGSGSTTASTNYVHSDHLNSTRMVTSEIGDQIQQLSYTAFGALDSNIASTTFKETNQFIGENYDVESQLSYLNARYYEGSRGQFLSQDPSFLDIGAAGFEQRYDRTLQQHLMNPQALNSYSYGLNNPITNKDPEGEIVPLLIGAWAAVEFGLSAYDAYETGSTLADPNASWSDKALSSGGFVAGLALPGGGYGVGAKNIKHIIPADQAKHIFGNRAGHIADTPANRAMLTNLANNPKTTLGVDKHGNTWSASINKDGTQNWAQSRDGKIINGGVNQTPKTWDPKTGLSSPTKPTNKKNN